MAPSPRPGSSATGLMRLVRSKRYCRSPVIRTNRPRICSPSWWIHAHPLFDATEVAHPLLSGSNRHQQLIPVLRASRPQDLKPLGTSGPDCERLEHVGQKHADADRPSQRRFSPSPARRFARKRVRLTPMVVGTCLRHTDSLQEHRSGFYTEALRIRPHLTIYSTARCRCCLCSTSC